MNLGLKDKIVLVTGSGQGIGKAIALKFAREGANLAINDINSETANRTVEEARKLGVSSEVFIADVANFTETDNMVLAVEKKFGRLDVLVNNAGINIPGPFEQITPEQWQKIMDVNLNGVFNCCAAAFKLMMKQNSGRIVSIGSYAGRKGALLGGAVPYCVSKAGVHGLTVALAPELAKYGITINAVAPGFVQTDLLMQHPEERRRMLAEASWLKRLGTVEDVASSVAFLASDEASFITGEIVDINGGLYMDT